MDTQSAQELITFLNTATSWAYDRPMTPIQVHYKQQSSKPVTTGVSLCGIAEKIAQCTRCDLHKTRTQTVPGFGSEKPLVMVIGEGPGAEEDTRGLPFVGPAGQLLDKMLAAIQLSRDTNCFIGNIVKCRPPGNRDPLPQESLACSAFLHVQIQLLKPKMILAVGRVAAQNLLNTTDGIGKLHGRFFDYSVSHGNETGVSETVPLMATYHPSALLRDASYKKPAWEDLKLFRQRLEELVPNFFASQNGEAAQSR